VVMLSNVFSVACADAGVSPAMVSITGNWEGNTFKGLATATVAQMSVYQRGGDTTEDNAAAADKGDKIVATFNSLKGADITFKKLEPAEVMEGIKNPDSINTVEIEYNGVKIKVSASAAAALKNNTFADKIGAGALLGKVDTVSGIVDGILNMIDPETGEAKEDTTFYQMIFGEGSTYISDLEKNLKMQPGELVSHFNSKEEFTSFLANSLVLTAAQKTENIDTSFLGTTGSAAQLRAELDSTDSATSTEAMAKLALSYGMYTSYVKYKGLEDKSETIINTGTFTGMTDVLSTIENKDFQDYLASPEGKADMDAYLASMKIVSDTTKNSSDATMDILTKGFDDSQLNSILTGLMTSGK